MNIHVNKKGLKQYLPNLILAKRCYFVLRGIDYFNVLEVLINTYGWLISSVSTWIDVFNTL